MLSASFSFIFSSGWSINLPNMETLHALFYRKLKSFCRAKNPSGILFQHNQFLISTMKKKFNTIRFFLGTKII
ncbi:hypothetical protein BpHYR1_047097 [Brachionus plicatilis]|uniref:Uncharacterized protein n=1 Tax=Brachionus plicatilis TaxID=10195 RepID=A0A3M7Q8B3_BRAPC|nr:hypothetical protein BpHYR1_047097 [Brachionus plicatilis]